MEEGKAKLSDENEDSGSDTSSVKILPQSAVN